MCSSPISRGSDVTIDQVHNHQELNTQQSSVECAKHGLLEDSGVICGKGDILPFRIEKIDLIRKLALSCTPSLVNPSQSRKPP